MICPNCLNEINFYYRDKVRTHDGIEGVYQCPKCNGYFKQSFPTRIWWSLLVTSPVLWHSFFPEEFEILKYSISGMLFVSILVFAVVLDRKKKRIIQEKGEWVVVKSINSNTK